MTNNEQLLNLITCLLTSNQASEKKPEASNAHPYTVGKSYHVRTVTYATAGRLKAVYENELVFEDASWVADTGRFSEYLKDTSKVSENEYVGEITVSRSAIVDVIEVSNAYDKTK